MHALEKGLFRFFSAEEMIEDCAFDAERLFPARRPFPNRIFEVVPQPEENVVGIEYVSSKRSLAGPAKISAGYALILVAPAVSSQEL